MEITGDLQVKTRELKVLKFRTLFESPDTAAEKREAKGGSFVAAASARAAYLGRSITKTSDDFRTHPLNDLIGDSKIKPDQTFKHTRVGSHYSQDMDRELNAASHQPRRKTVGFKQNATGSGMIAIEDVDSKNSH